MNQFINVYEFSQQLIGYVPQEYSIIYFIFTIGICLGICIVLFSPFILLGKVLSQ